MTRTAFYVRIDEEEIETIDKVAKKLGYANRTDIVTDLLHAIAHGRTFRKELPEVNEILSFSDEIDRLRDAFMDIIEEYAFPVVAMHGAEYSFKVLKEDLKTWMYKRCQAVPQDSDMREWLQIYYAVNKGRILRYRIQRMTESYVEDHEEEEE